MKFMPNTDWNFVASFVWCIQSMGLVLPPRCAPFMFCYRKHMANADNDDDIIFHGLPVSEITQEGGVNETINCNGGNLM